MSEPKTNDSTLGASEKPRPRWPVWVMTALLAAGVAFILTPQQLRFFQALERHRTDILAKPETRDFLIGAAYFRDLDRRLPPEAKIFFSGVIGPNDRLYPYFFARTFLFPHEVEISLDHKADYLVDGFRGVDCFSPDQLRSNGYDLQMKLDSNGNVVTFSLNEKGVPKQ